MAQSGNDNESVKHPEKPLVPGPTADPSLIDQAAEESDKDKTSNDALEKANDLQRKLDELERSLDELTHDL